MNRGFSSRAVFVATVGVLSIVALGLATAEAVEVTVQNDSFISGGPGVIVGDFVPGEEVAVLLTSPCEGSIVGVQISWLDGGAGVLQSLEQAIHIYGAGFPAPGPVLETLEAPLLTVGALNEFRAIDEQGAVPLDVPVTMGQQFVVSLEFANATDVNGGGASVLRDVDGCAFGRNAVFAIPGGWFDLCLLTSGDIVIRALVDCGSPLGACCNVDGNCLEDVEEDACQDPGELFFLGEQCAQVSCPTPTGACCASGGGCLPDQEVAFCENVLGGVYGGNGTSCNDPVCDAGACCQPDGSCSDLIEISCNAAGGIYQGAATDCASTTCPQPGGACCVGVNCVPNIIEADCLSFGGNWSGAGTSCSPDPCAPGCASTATCPNADVDCNNIVNGADVLIITNSANFGLPTSQAANPAADVDGNGVITGADVLAATNTGCFGI